MLVDPEKPIDGVFVFENLSNHDAGSFAKGILTLSEILARD